MKVPAHKIEFKKLDEGYGGYFATIPRSLPEGTLNFIQGRNLEADRIADRVETLEDDKKKKEAAEQLLAFRRETNAMVLDLIVEWNLDDDEGKVLPLPSTVKDAAEKIEIMSHLPLEVIGLIATEIWNPSKRQEAVDEDTKDFSKGSSEAA